MCGIVGFAVSEAIKTKYQDRKETFTAFAAQGLYIDALRGDDATGIAMVMENKHKEAARVYKRALSANDFMQLQATSKLFEDIPRASLFIGHNRAATRASLDDNNAHPHQVDHITLVHNGTLHSYHHLSKRNPADVDSAYIAAAIADGDAAEVLPRLNGSFSLVWHNAKDGTLNFARNKERPMYWAHVKGMDGLLFASEWELLAFLSSRNGIELRTNYLFPEPGFIYSFNLDNLEKFSRTEYKSTNFTQAGYSHPSASNSTAWHRRGLPSDTTPMAEGGTGTQQPVGGHGGGAGSERLANIGPTKVQIDKVIAVRSSGGGPLSTGHTKPKKILAAKERLRLLDIPYSSVIYGRPVGWAKYRNQQNIGSAFYIGSAQHSFLLERHNVRKEEYDALARTGYGEDLIALDTKLTDAETKEYGYKLLRIVVVQKRVATETTLPAPTTSNVLHLMHKGPNGERVSNGRYRELTEDGCVCCSGVINPQFSDKVLWAGEYGRDPICHECATRPEMLQLANIDINQFVTH